MRPTSQDHDSPKWLVCRQALLVVAELHAAGFERLRIIPSILHPHMVWHCWVAPCTYVSSHHGARWSRRAGEVENLSKHFPHHLGLFSCPYNLASSHECSPARVAALIVQNFPEVCEQGRSADTKYVEWYQGMIEATAPDGLIYAYAEDENLDAHLGVAGYLGMEIPLPPPPLSS